MQNDNPQTALDAANDTNSMLWKVSFCGGSLLNPWHNSIEIRAISALNAIRQAEELLDKSVFIDGLEVL